MSKTKKPQFVEFVLNEPRPAQWSFRNYFNSDYEDCHLVQSKQGDREKQALIKWHAHSRIIKIPVNKQDIYGKKYADFIRNSPWCKGSPLCAEGAHLFYELNPIKDAKVKLEEEKLRVRATSYALELEGDKLSQIASLKGCFHEDEDVQRAAVMDFAKVNPREFNDIAQSPTIAFFALYEKALNVGIIQSKGFLKEAVIDGTVIPLGNKNSAIDKLTNDKALYASVKTAVEKVEK